MTLILASDVEPHVEPHVDLIAFNSDYCPPSIV